MELGQLERFEQEIKDFRECFNLLYSQKLLSELPERDFFWKSLISSDPNERFSIQELDEALSEKKAEVDLLILCAELY